MAAKNRTPQKPDTGTQHLTKQIDKFKDLARELETNEDEAAFDRALKKIAKQMPSQASDKVGTKADQARRDE